MTPGAGQSKVGYESYILRAHVRGITDLDGFARDPAALAASVNNEPELAAAAYFARRDRYSVPFEGFVSFTLDGKELLGPRLWDDVTSIWRALVVACQGFMAVGIGDDTLDGQPVVIRMERQGRMALLSVAGVKHVVDPITFIPAVLMGAKEFFEWCHTVLGMPSDGQELTSAVAQRFVSLDHAN